MKGLGSGKGPSPSFRLQTKNHLLPWSASPPTQGSLGCYYSLAIFISISKLPQNRAWTQPKEEQCHLASESLGKALFSTRCLVALGFL